MLCVYACLYVCMYVSTHAQEHPAEEDTGCPVLPFVALFPWSVTEPGLAVCKWKQSFVSVPTVVGLQVLSQLWPELHVVGNLNSCLCYSLSELLSHLPIPRMLFLHKSMDLKTSNDLLKKNPKKHFISRNLLMSIVIGNSMNFQPWKTVTQFTVSSYVMVPCICGR